MTAHAVLSLPDGRRISYVDKGAGSPLVALHGTFGRGAVFDRLAHDLGAAVRVLAPDQRGHGLSDPADDFSRAAFVADVARFIEALDVGPVALLGHSLGGVTAYQVAARHPHLVAALVIEDVGAVTDSSVVDTPVLDTRGWPRSAPTRAALAAALIDRGIPDPTYFLLSAVAENGQWRFLFDWEQMMAVQRAGAGSWWSDWTAATCPTLLLRATQSPFLPAPLADEMADRRPGTEVLTFPTGHWIHDDDPTGFATAVADFLDTVSG
ncbi:alpha/beta hydrolase [Actinokineospora auranticolor]|uniref:alpha/beta fold hydrolase n=1 Tax=Actinokineospora auranticolor TaxID=155976 RepID=UPI001FEC2E10|nr:alpha/beta hydrolase [Actinokineospora auranticolor]